MKEQLSNSEKEPSPQAQEIIHQLRIAMIDADDDTLDFIKNAVLMIYDQEKDFRRKFGMGNVTK